MGTMLKKLTTWLRGAWEKEGPGRVARWLGRGWARLHYATRVEPTWLELNRHEVPIAGLPAGFEGLRVVQMTDFHCSHKVGVGYLSEAVELAQAQQPDVVVLTGDFIHKGFHHIGRVAGVLGQLRA